MQKLSQRGVKNLSRAAKQAGSRARSSPSHFSDPSTRVIFPPVQAALGRAAENGWGWEMLCAGKK